MFRIVCSLFVALSFLVSSADAGVKFGLNEGTPDIKSAGPLVVGPEVIRCLGDAGSAALVAVAMDDAPGKPS